MHFGLIHVRLGQRYLVKLVMVVSVSLHRQRCYNFCKMQQENAKWTGAVVKLWRFAFFSPWGPL